MVWDVKSESADNEDSTCHNEWRTFCTRKEPRLDVETKNTCQALGECKVGVHMIDNLGNDTTRPVNIVAR